MVSKYKFNKPRKWNSAAAHRLIKIAGNPKTVEDAVFIMASRLLEGISCPPCDLGAICKKLNIREVVSGNIPYSGELRKEEGWGFKIVYSSFLSETRKRFTIAHECGHAIFDWSGKNWPHSGEELEQICNMLASEILMPKNLFLKCAENEISLDKVYKLAQTFKTSLSTTAVRYALLRNFFVFEVNNRKVTLSLSKGLIKKGSSISELDETLQETICRTYTEKQIEEKIYLRNGIWGGVFKLEGKLVGRSNKTLFLLQPETITSFRNY